MLTDHYDLSDPRLVCSIRFGLCCGCANSSSASSSFASASSPSGSVSPRTGALRCLTSVSPPCCVPHRAGQLVQMFDGSPLCPFAYLSFDFMISYVFQMFSKCFQVEEVT